MWAIGPILLTAVCLAPAPDYRAELGARLAAHVQHVADVEGLDAAIRFAAEVEDDVGSLVDVRYQAALARNQAGHIGPAIKAYGRVLALDPDHVGALYDRAELWLVAGSSEDRVQARADLERAEVLRPDHWAVPYRLALLAGQNQQTAQLEAAMTRSISAGLDLRLLLQDPAWLPLLRREATGGVLRRIVATYGSEALLRELEDAAARP